MTTAWTRTLEHLRAADVAFAGGKGANLGELVAAGMPVPEAFVVGVPATAALAAAEGGLPSGLEEAVRRGLADLGADVAVAVRSSAVAEDGAAASYAGINETVHNVRGVQDVVAAICACVASTRSDRAAGYDAARGGVPRDAGVAVVVQRQVASARAGVVFTADPLTGDTDRIVIEAARGLGEAVVSGAVTPDRIVVDKASLGVRAYAAGAQSVVLETADAGGIAERALPPHEAAAPVLTDAEILTLAQHARAIEQHYGRPQDVEWAFGGDGRLWILQARPITALGDTSAQAQALRFYDHARPAGSRWTRANIGEAIPGVPTPITWSLWSDGMEAAHWAVQIALGVVPAAEDRSAPVVVLARGWPAISVDLVAAQLERLPGFDPEAFGRQFFGEAVPGHAISAATRARTAARVARHAPPSLARLGRDLRAATTASARAWARDAWRPPADPAALLREAAARFTATMTVHTLQTYVCQGLYQAVERVAGDRAPELVSGDGDLSEARLATDLWRLAHGDLEESAFLRGHGFHGPAEGELASPSWREDPGPVRRTAAQWAEADEARDPRESTRRRRELRARCEAELLATTAPVARPAVRGLLAMARRAVVAREAGKAAFLQDLDVARTALRALGDEAEWWTLAEAAGDRAPSPATIAARRRVRERFAAAEPPVVFVGDAAAVDGEVTRAGDAGTVLHGTGASPGIVRGRARVVIDPAAGGPGLGPDEVLVAHTTDPSWVTTFLTAGGLAIDVGGALSHAAIIARELGVPCVIGTGDGTSTIPDGALVELDGHHGTVRILDVAGVAEPAA